MSQASLSGFKVDEASEESRHRITDDPQAGWEKSWVWLSERINPIVVKEVRQSLKSRQFTISFGLTLIAAIAWTLIAVSLLVPRIYYVPGGMPLLAGFFCILILPLMVIIPFSAFRSLTAETEDSTFELLSISALTSTQIIHGKMASACVQIALYLSALAPCIVLTYLLRGVGLSTILFFLALTVVFALCETAVALLLASVSRSRMLQNGVSVLLLIGVLLASFSWVTLILGNELDLFGGLESQFLLGLIAVGITAAFSISLVLRAAAAAIDFPSENNSTSIRWRILGLLALFLFWTVWGTRATGEMEILLVFVFGSFAALLVIGSLITGEHGIISPRAQRTLPKSFLGRLLFSWFYPGAGLGFIFVVCLFASLALTCALTEVYLDVTQIKTNSRYSISGTAIVLLCHLTIYLGINRVFLYCLSSKIGSRMVASVAMLVVILLFAHLLPLFTVFYFNDYREFDYDWHQALNIFWTVSEVNRTGVFTLGGSLILLTVVASCCFLLNLMICSRDIMLVRVAMPERVLAEETARVEEKPATDPFAD